MKKAEYMELAKAALQNGEKEFMEDMLLLLEEHFEEGMQEGKSEEELCEELGPVEAILEELGLPGDVKVQPLEKESENKWKHVRHLPSVQDSNNKITKIYADLDFADVKFIRTDEQIPSIYLSEGSDTPAEYELLEEMKGDTYEVRLVKSGKARSAASGSFMKRLMNVFTPDIRLELYVPKDTEELSYFGTSGDIETAILSVRRLRIESISGEIDMKNVFAPLNALFKTTSGNGDLSGVMTANFGWQTVSGDVDVDGIQAEKLRLQTVSGDVDIKNMLSDSAEVHTTSGDLDISACKMRELKVGSVSGDIEVTNASLQSVTSHTTSGDVELHLEGEADIKAKSMSGDVKIYLSNAGGGIQGQVKSMSGSTHVYYGDYRKSGQGNCSFHAGQGASWVEVSTMSGDVTVQEE